MSMTDPIADMLTRIRNGQQSKLISVEMPFSKMKTNILEVLVEEGFVASYAVEDLGNEKQSIEVHLKYFNHGKPVIQKIIRESKPGKRMYSSIKALKGYYNNMGIHILSTSKGILSDRKARQLGVGGEVICKVF